MPVKNKILLKNDFEKNPFTAGWSVPAPRSAELAPTWSTEDAFSGKRSLFIPGGGYWESPAFAVNPFEYYKLEFRSKADDLSYWAAFFYRENCEILTADHYSSMDGSSDWIQNSYCFHGKADASMAKVRFQPQNKKNLYIDDVTVTAVTRADVCKWSDALYATIPKVKFRQAPDCWKYLPRTMDALRNGKKLRIVMLGDSIINDTSNSQFAPLVERMYPNSRLEVVASVRGGTGCWYYKDQFRIKEYVLDYKPDLLVIGGISNGNADDVQNVVKQIRAHINPDVLLMTGAVSTKEYNPMVNKEWTPTVNINGKGYRSALMRVATQEQCEFFDMAGAWGQYALSCGKPYEWFLRDPVVHANARGGMVLARILELYFAPKTR